MEEQVEYTPETPAESAEATPEVTGEQVQAEAVEQVEQETVTTAEPEEAKVPLKAVQDERRKRQEIAKESEYWRKVALGEIEHPITKQEALVKPDPTQFSDYDAYVEALADYKARQIFRTEQEQTRKLTAEDIQRREVQKLQEKAARDAQAAAKKYTDFYEVAQQVVLPKQALEALYQSDLGTEITYYLGKNQAELERIADLPPSRQIMEIGKLEVKLASKTANPETKRVKEATKVETAGQGIKPQTTNLQQLRQEAIKTGRWEKYIEAAGFLPT